MFYTCSWTRCVLMMTAAARLRTDWPCHSYRNSCWRTMVWNCISVSALEMTKWQIWYSASPPTCFSSVILEKLLQRGLRDRCVHACCVPPVGQTFLGLPLAPCLMCYWWYIPEVQFIHLYKSFYSDSGWPTTGTQKRDVKLKLIIFSVIFFLYLGSLLSFPMGEHFGSFLDGVGWWTFKKKKNKEKKKRGIPHGSVGDLVLCSL